MKESLVSIIIPVFNRANLIGDTLDSIINQTYKCWECIVVDDRSTDNTLDVLKKYAIKDKRIHYYTRPKNRLKGANACRNYGYELSKGEYINWFDSDDIMHKDKLLKHITIIRGSNFNYSICQTLVFEKTINNIIGLRNEEFFSSNIFEDYLTHNIVFMTGSVFWERKFLSELDYLFDEELKAAQEWEFYCRALSQDNKYINIDIPLVYLRQHERSITYDNSKVKEREWHYFLARCKVYFNKNIKKSDYIDKYLQDYLLKRTKKYLISKQYKLSLKAFLNYFLKDKKISLQVKFYGVFFMVSSFFFNKGYFFYKKINYLRK